MSLIVKKKKLQGSVKVSGAKNSSLRLLAASVLTCGTIKLSNFPNGLLDVKVHLEMLAKLGKSYQVLSDDQVLITESASGLNTQLDWDERSIRNTLLILGSLVARYGKGRVPLPGGCKLGERKYDLHVYALERLGAQVWEEGNYLCAEIKSGRLIGNEIHLSIRSTGATENSILMGSLAIGKTTIYNPHIRPEIVDLIDLLTKMGARIKLFGQRSIEIEGVESLEGASHEVVPDNMEAITWAIGSVITNGDVEIINFPYDHLEIPLIYLRESGMKYYRGSNSIIVKGGNPYPVEISTGPYPGINSDMQPLFAVYGSMSKGTTKIVDLRFPGRYGYADELVKIGVEAKTDGDILIINGGNPIIGGTVKALDLRAGIALMLAGMTCESEVVIEDEWQINRGYENIEAKLSSLS